MNIAIIVAAGKSVRMKQNKNKSFILLNKKEIIYYCLNTFQKHKQIDRIIIATAKKDMAEMKKFLNKNKFNKVIAIIEGGKERQDTSCCTLKFINQISTNIKNDIVLFHNSANPFVTDREISELIKETKKYGASVVGIPIKDTIKSVNKNQIITSTIPRHNLWAVQTPQAIKVPLAIKAFTKAEKEKFQGTDDVSLVERIGKKVKIIPASENNFKITTPDDLIKAEMILKNNLVK